MSADVVPAGLVSACLVLLAACSTQVPATLTPEQPTVEVGRACTEPSPVAGDGSRGARDVGFGEAVSITQVDNVQTQDDIIELTVSEPALVDLEPTAASTSGTVGWQVQVDARQISGTPAVSVFDLLLVDAEGGSCTLHSVDPDAALLAPGEAQRQVADLTFAVPDVPADDYELYLLDPRSREVLLRWP